MNKPHHRKKLIVGAPIVVAAVLSAAVAAFALWSAEDTFAGGRATAGNLSISYGDGTWRQVTPGVGALASGTLENGVEGFVSMPGDVVEIAIPVTTTLRGENLNATLSVATGPGASADIAAGLVSASYRVESAPGVKVAPASGEAQLGSPVRVPNLESSNAGITARWTIVVTVHVLGDYRWASQAPLLDLSSWSVDGIDVTLQQVREGQGFALEGGER